jgi:hypothetical protein
MSSDSSIAPTLEEANEVSSTAFLEKQLLETLPDMDVVMRGALARLGAAIARKSTTQTKPEPEPALEPPWAEQTGQLILFPQ